MPSSQSQRIGAKNVVLTLIMGASLWLALVNVASAEVIRSFDVDYEIHDDSSVTVTETIVYDFEEADRRGIFRNIKDKHPQPASAWYKERYVGINLISVSRDGNPEPYVLESYDGLSVRIGEANKTITGSHTYRIVYQLEGAIAKYQEEGTEFYWNVTGNEWDVSINDVSVSVHTTSGAQLLPTQACYVGQSGSINDCSNKEIKGNVALFSQAVLFPGQGLTIAQRLVTTNPPVVLEYINYFVFLIPIGIVWFIVSGIGAYWWRIKNRSSQAIIAHYEPFEGFNPMFTGVMIDNSLGSKDISAAIIYLAQQGFISIKQISDKVFFLFDTTDYEVTLLRQLDETETSFQKEILKMLFSEDNKLGEVVRLSEIKKDQSKVQSNLIRIQKLKKAVINDLIDRGFMERMKKTYRWFSILLTVVITIIALPFLMTVGEVGWVFAVPIILGCVIFVSYTDKRKTRKGYEAVNHLKGFKDFLSVTKKRYQFHNAPALSPQQFMEYLPYAIAFGVEKEWAEVFKDIQIDSPGWYSSSSGASFNAVSLTTGLGAFSTAFAGSTGSSGSSGGGSTGGGGGGGGGGSW